MILDAQPKKGVLILDETDYFDREVGRIDGRIHAPAGGMAIVVDVYTDHHVTCPDAKAWTGRTRSTPPEQLPAPLGGWPVADS